MDVPFTKMHGLGNDFVLIEEDQLPPDVALDRLATVVCDRHFGIGADGMIIISPPDDPALDIQFKFYNSDGSLSAMCGNGIRCFARYIKDQGIIKRHEFKVQLATGTVTPHINADYTVTVDMGRPLLSPERIPFTGQTEAPVIDFNLPVEGFDTIPVTAIGMGNPHCVIFAAPNAAKPLPFETVGPLIEHHPMFPAKTNVEFAEVADRQTIRLKVWERGVGPTMACGSGACATMVAAHLKGLVDDTVWVYLPGGPLVIDWNGHDNIKMTGPASYVFAGVYPLTDARVSAVAPVA